jgi:hypothetical protein
MVVIPVPKPPTSSYNPQRRASELLKRQVEHLEWAVRPASQRQPALLKKIKAPKTEAEAAARIAMLTQQLHADGAPVSPPATKPLKKSKPAKKSATAASAVEQAPPAKRAVKRVKTSAPKRRTKALAARAVRKR